MTHPGIIQVSGETAHTRFALEEIARYAGGARGMTILAFYQDELRKCQDDKWRFVRLFYSVVNWDDRIPRLGAYTP